MNDLRYIFFVIVCGFPVWGAIMLAILVVCNDWGVRWATWQVEDEMLELTLIILLITVCLWLMEL